MKKLLMMALVAMGMTLGARAELEWSWWMDHPEAKPDVSFGIAARCAQVDTFEFTLLYGGSKVDGGVQWSLLGINDSDKATVLQLSPWFNRGNEACVQLGMMNFSDDVTFSMGLLNVSDCAKFQLGFLNFNKRGFLPVFPFINFKRDLFD